MPQVVVAAAIGAGVTTAFASAATIAAGGAFLGLAAGSTAAFFATSFATTLVLGGLSQALAKKPSSPSLSLRSSGQTVSSRSPVGSHEIIYGRTRVGGNIVHMEGTSSNKYLHMVIAVAGHEIDGFETVYFDDEAVALDGNGFGYSGKARIQFKLGADDQTAFSDLVSESESGWTNNHRLRGRACAYVRLEFDQDKFPNGIPNISFIVRGKKVFDPRTSTTAWSANPALCLNDYLTNTRFGMSCNYGSEIDVSALIASANICDELVPLAAGGNEKRYECHGVISTANTPQDIINNLLSSMAGKAVFTSGKWRILAGAYYTPTLTFDENDLRGGFRVQSLVSRRENFNSIKGIFSSSVNNYIVTDFPPVVSDTYIAQDGEQVIKNIELSLTTSASMAQRLAKIELLKARQQITLTLPMKLHGLQANVGDIVRINNTRMGWSLKPFEVVSMQMSIGEALGVDLELREISLDVFDWNTSEESPFDAAPNSNLPNPLLVSPPGITVSDRLQIINEQVATVLAVSVTSGDAFVDRYEVQAKLQTAIDWINLGQATGNLFELPFVQDGVFYDVRARLINTFGVRSAFTSGSWQVVGQTAPPADVTGFSVNIVGNEAHFSWIAVPDLDLSHYKIRYSSLTTGATYSDAVDLIPKISRPATFATTPAMTGTYFIKAFDKQGIASLNPAEIVTLVDGIEGLNVVETSTQHPTFSGAKTDTVIVDGKLQLDTSILFDSFPGDFDSGLGDFDGGGGSMAASGEYEFNAPIDLGNIYTSRVTVAIETSRIDYVKTFDAAEGLFDSRPGLFDGDVQTFDDVNVEFYVATTNNDPAGSPVWSAWRQFFVGDYTARAFKFKAVLTTTDPQATPAISVLSVTVDMPDRVVAGDDIISGTDAGGKVVTFTRAFKVAPAIGIAAQNLQQGDFYEITTKSASGFTIRFKNSGGTVVSRTFDYVAKGYGSLAV